MVVNEVTGQPINEVFGDRIWRKIGAQNDAYTGVTKYWLATARTAHVGGTNLYLDGISRRRQRRSASSTSSFDIAIA